MEEEITLNSIAGKDWVNTDVAKEWIIHDARDEWGGSGFGVSRDWHADQRDATVPFDSVGQPERDPRMRWSVDF
jgi:hypothetical protein